MRVRGAPRCRSTIELHARGHVEIFWGLVGYKKRENIDTDQGTTTGDWSYTDFESRHMDDCLVGKFPCAMRRLPPRARAFPLWVLYVCYPHDMRTLAPAYRVHRFPN